MIAAGAGAAAAASSSTAASSAVGEPSPQNGEVALPVGGPGGDDVPKMHQQEGGKPLPHQHKVDLFYNGVQVQVGVAALICANFLTNMIEKQVDPQGSKFTPVFEGLDLFYNVAFTTELFVNLYAHWFKAFWQSKWNIFDVVVVTIGVVNMLKLPLPKAFSLLRMMRAFRVFRLFKRVKSLNRIIVSIVHSIPGVMNAFLILTIIMAIYAILGIEFFKDVGDDCHSLKWQNGTWQNGTRPNGALANGTWPNGTFVSTWNKGELVSNATKPGHLSLRKFCTGEEYFGTFSRSMYSFFQVLTGESWSELIARPVIFYYADDWVLAAGSALYFVSFVIITGIILTNVVVAILLDKMSETQEPEESSTEAAEEDTSTAVATTVVTPSEPPAPLTETEGRIYRQSVEVLAGVDKLMTKSTTMQSEFDNMKIDMVAMKDQLSAIGAMVEKRQRAVAVKSI